MMSRVTLPPVLAMIMALLFTSGTAGAQSENTDGVSNGSIRGTWDVECAAKGCIMFRDVKMSDADGSNLSDYITIGVAVEPNAKNAVFVSFQTAPDVEQKVGFTLFFGEVTNENGKLKGRVDSPILLIPFENCDADRCVARAMGGVAKARDSDETIDLLERFQRNGTLTMAVGRNGEWRRATEFLLAFQNDFKQVLDRFSGAN
jgi:hypothetical protein